MTDKRILRTKKSITDAFIRLLDEKDFDDISVPDILAAASYTKTTFYKHYGGKKDLSEKIMNETLEEFDQAITAYKRSHQHVPWNSAEIRNFNEMRFMFIYERRELFKALFTYPCFALFPRKLQDYINDLQVPYELFPRSNVSYNEYFNFSIAHIFAGTIYYWIREGFRSSPKLISEMYSETFCIDEES